MQNNKEEQEFYKELGKFIKIMQSTSRLDDVINNCPEDNRIKELITDEMLSRYKKGKSRISFYKLLKLTNYYGYDPVGLVGNFNEFLKRGNYK